MLTHTKILYSDRASWNRSVTSLIHIACTISSAIERIVEDQDKKPPPPQCCFPTQQRQQECRKHCNLARLGKSWNEFNFLQARKIDPWKKMRTAIEIIGTGILIKELEAIKIWTEIKLLLEIKWTRKKYSSVALLKLDDFRRKI